MAGSCEHIKVGNLFTSRVTISFSRRILLHDVGYCISAVLHFTCAYKRTQNNNNDDDDDGDNNNNIWY
jgi:hypothetical protein